MFDLAWDAGLDDAQLAAVTHGSDPLVVVAGAGTGKTRTLTSRVARLLETGVRPERVLLLTFTRRAAEDMVARAAATCGDPSAARRVWGGTFHAVAHRVVSEFADVLGLPEVTVLDPSDVTDLLDLLRDDHGLTDAPGGGSSRRPRAANLADVYSRAVNTGRPVRAVLDTDFPWISSHADAVTAVLRAYVARKRERGLLDFDDLLLTWRALLDHEATGEVLRARWDHVLVDEYQDVNAVQVDIVRGLAPEGRGLTVVGDDAQAVYGFRGAASGHLLELAGTLQDARIVTLERNFRSRQPVLDLANVIRPGDGAGRVVLRSHRDGGAASTAERPRLVRAHDPADEARRVVDDILAEVDAGGRLRDHAVLMRSSNHSDLLEVELTSRHVPFVKYGGLKFLEAAHVKDFLAALRVTHNVADEVAWFRLLRLHEGIGPARARALLGGLLEAASAEGVTADDLNAVVAAAPSAARTTLAVSLLGLLDARRSGVPADQVTACVGVVRPLVAARYADSPARLEDLDRLGEAARTSGDLAAYVAELTLDPPASTTDHAKPPHLDDDYLTLSTVHSAKGLEWPSVHVLHAVDGAFPSDMALAGSNEGIEEEQRLFYVALTRARDRLAVYTPLRMPHHRRGRDDKHSYAPQSRFLTDEAVATMDVVLPAARVVAGVGPAGSGLRARVAIPTLDALLD